MTYPNSRQSYIVDGGVCRFLVSRSWTSYWYSIVSIVYPLPMDWSDKGKTILDPTHLSAIGPSTGHLVLFSRQENRFVKETREDSMHMFSTKMVLALGYTPSLHEAKFVTPILYRCLTHESDKSGPLPHTHTPTYMYTYVLLKYKYICGVRATINSHHQVDVWFVEWIQYINIYIYTIYIYTIYIYTIYTYIYIHTIYIYVCYVYIYLQYIYIYIQYIFIYIYIYTR